RETELSVGDLVQPLFVREGSKIRKPISSMPGQFQLSVDELVKECAEIAKLGIPGVILFGIPEKKDDKASGAYSTYGVIPTALRVLKKELPDLLVIADVCLCEYMSHGHCGIVRKVKSSGARSAGGAGVSPANKSSASSKPDPVGVSPAHNYIIDNDA